MQGRLDPSDRVRIPVRERTLVRDARGQSYIEFLLVLPVLLLLVMGLVELALLLRAQLVLTNATREGARLASRGAGDDEVAERVIYAFSRQLPARVEPLEEANAGIIVTRFFVPGIVTGTSGTTGTTTMVAESYGKVPFVVEGGSIAHVSQIAPSKWMSFTVSDAEPDSTHDVVIVETYYQHNLAFYTPIEPLARRYLPEIFVLYDRSTMRVSVPYVRQAIKGE